MPHGISELKKLLNDLKYLNESVKNLVPYKLNPETRTYDILLLSSSTYTPKMKRIQEGYKQTKKNMLDLLSSQAIDLISHLEDEIILELPAFTRTIFLPDELSMPDIIIEKISVAIDRIEEANSSILTTKHTTPKIHLILDIDGTLIDKANAQGSEHFTHDLFCEPLFILDGSINNLHGCFLNKGFYNHLFNNIAASTNIELTICSAGCYNEDLFKKFLVRHFHAMAQLIQEDRLSFVLPQKTCMLKKTKEEKSFSQHELSFVNFDSGKPWVFQQLEFNPDDIIILFDDSFEQTAFLSSIFPRAIGITAWAHIADPIVLNALLGFSQAPPAISDFNPIVKLESRAEEDPPTPLLPKFNSAFSGCLGFTPPQIAIHICPLCKNEDRVEQSEQTTTSEFSTHLSAF